MTDFFDGADAPSEITDITGTPRRGTEWLSVPGQAYFGIVASRMRQLGWAVLPQDRDGRRLPSIISGERIKWKQYQSTPPSQELTDRWATMAPSANAAVLLGEASGNIVCLDLDIMEVDLSLQIQEIAESILGLSPFRRIGKLPKLALFYRMEAAELPKNSVYYLMETDGQTRSEHMLEIKAHGTMMTAFGLHYETGSTFKWQDCRPWHTGPEAAPLITAGQLQHFLDAVEEVRAFHRNAGAGTAVEFDYVDADGIDLPRVRSAGSAGGWVEDAEGYVEGGREKFLFALARRTVRSNPSACVDERGILKLKKVVLDEALRTVRMTGKWSESHIRSEVSEKVGRFAAQVADGTLTPVVRETTVLPSDELSKAIVGSKKSIAQDDDAFSWLHTARGLLKVGFQDGPRGSAEAWALKTDRAAIHKQVSDTVHAGLDAFFDDVRDGVKGGRVHVIKAPTGAGKTALGSQRIMEEPDMKVDDALPVDKRRGPLVFLMPTYNNIDEVRVRFLSMGMDPEMTDDDVEAAAAELGLVSEKDVQDELDELTGIAEAHGIRSMVYRGKVAAGCAFPVQMAQLMEADIASSGMCKSTIKNELGEREESFCKHYSTCPAIDQRADIAQAHVVFLPRAFLTITIPEELKKTRGVIADEKIWDMLAHTNLFPIAALKGTRPDPTLTKAEREAGSNPHAMVEQRGIVADLAIEALEQGEDIALHIRKQRPADGMELVRIAKRVCSSAIQSGQTVRPGMHEQDFLDLVTAPKSKFVKAEHRLWSIVLEDIEAMVNQELAGRTVEPDNRIQLIHHENAEQQVRLSWRTEPNWADAPLLLLDASADEMILERVFPGREIKIYECENDPNLRMIAFPDRSLAVTRLLGRNGGDELKAAEGLLAIRRMVTAICAAHSNGRVVVCTTKPIREVICAEWVPPANADFLHDGAVAGLDFAKDHVALISLGRTELPVTTIDGLVAALTNGMKEPEFPIDRNGTGLDGKGKPILPHKAGRKTRMRDGRYAVTQHQAHKGAFARAVQKQAREEEIRQRIGRVRGVYRETPAVVYLIGEAMPDDIVLDDIRSYSDLESGFMLLDVARQCGGILSPEMIAKQASDQYTVAAAEKEIAKLSERFLRNYRCIGWTDLHGEDHIAHVPTHYDDMQTEATFVAFARALGLPKGFVNRGTEVVPAVAPHGPRPHDKVEEALGTIDERRLQEESFRRQVKEYEMSIGQYRPASMSPIGKQKATYHIHPDRPDKAEIGAIHLLRLLRGITDVPAETGIEANAILAETGDDLRLAG